MRVLVDATIMTKELPQELLERVFTAHTRPTAPPGSEEHARPAHLRTAVTPAAAIRSAQFARTHAVLSAEAIFGCMEVVSLSVSVVPASRARALTTDEAAAGWRLSGTDRHMGSRLRVPVLPPLLALL